MPNEREVPSHIRQQFDAIFGNGNQPPAEAQATPQEVTPTSESQPSNPVSYGTDDSDEAFLKADPSDSPEIAEKKKNLEAGFHRKMAKLAEERRRLEEMIGGERQKAQAFDMLLNHPDPAALLEQVKKGQPVQQVAQTVQSPLPKGEYMVPDSLKDKFEPDTLSAIKELFDLFYEQAFSNRLMPVLTPYQKMVEEYGRGMYEDKWKGIEKEFPTASKYRAKAESIAQQMNIPMREALLLASDGAVVAEKVKTDMQSARRNELTPTGAPPSVMKPARSNGKIGLDRGSLARQLADMARQKNLEIFKTY